MLFPLKSTDQLPGLAETLLGLLRVVLGDAQEQKVQDQQAGGPGGHGPYPEFRLLAGDVEGIVGQAGEGIAVGLGDGDDLAPAFPGRLGVLYFW